MPGLQIVASPSRGKEFFWKMLVMSDDHVGGSQQSCCVSFRYTIGPRCISWLSRVVHVSQLFLKVLKDSTEINW